MAHVQSSVAVPVTACFERGSFMLLIQLPPSHSIFMVGYSFGTLKRVAQYLCLGLHGGEWYSFQGWTAPDDTVVSGCVVAIKPGDSGLLTGYQVDEFTNIVLNLSSQTLLTEQNWIHALMRLILCLLQPQQSFWTWYYFCYFKLQLTSSIKYHKLWCQAKALLLPVPQVGKILSWFVIFLVIKLYLDSRLPCHLSVLLRILPVRGSESFWH